jgi:hypothetical protein
MTAQNPAIAKIYRNDFTPITVFRNDYWHNRQRATTRQFEFRIRYLARQLSEAHQKPVAWQILRTEYAILFIYP